MSRKPFYISMLILMAVVAGIVYLSLGPVYKEAAKDTTTTTTTKTTKQTTTKSKPKESTSSPGSYVEYRDDSIAQSSGTKLLFFHAPWCPQCRDLDADIKAEGVPSGVTIIKVDYDSNQALRQKYGVTIQTTVVRVTDSGELVERYVAYDEPTLNAVIKNLL